jgi:hypothetical protein
MVGIVCLRFHWCSSAHWAALKRAESAGRPVASHMIAGDNSREDPMRRAGRQSSLWPFGMFSARIRREVRARRLRGEIAHSSSAPRLPSSYGWTRALQGKKKGIRRRYAGDSRPELVVLPGPAPIRHRPCHRADRRAVATCITAGPQQQNVAGGSRSGRGRSRTEWPGLSSHGHVARRSSMTRACARSPTSRQARWHQLPTGSTFHYSLGETSSRMIPG